MSQWKKILVVGAHFDDVEINCGGTVAACRQNGSEVLVVVVGDGYYKDSFGRTVRSKKIALSEGREALGKLGVDKKNLLTLNFQESRIPYNNHLVSQLDRVILVYRPDVIITHWLYDTHQDHCNVSSSVVSAARYQNTILMWEPIYPSGRNNVNVFSPQLYVDISNFYLAKEQSIFCHASQVKKFNNYKINWLAGIKSRNSYRGFEANCHYAEAFYVFRYKITFSSNAKEKIL